MKENLISFSANIRTIRHNAIVMIESVANNEVRSAVVSFRIEGMEIKVIPEIIPKMKNSHCKDSNKYLKLFIMISFIGLFLLRYQIAETGYKLIIISLCMSV